MVCHAVFTGEVTRSVHIGTPDGGPCARSIRMTRAFMVLGLLILGHTLFCVGFGAAQESDPDDYNSVVKAMREELAKVS